MKNKVKAFFNDWFIKTTSLLYIVMLVVVIYDQLSGQGRVLGGILALSKVFLIIIFLYIGAKWLYLKLIKKI